MAKKSVIGNRATNPALQFFSTPAPIEEEIEVIEPVPPVVEEPKQPAVSVDAVPVHQIATTASTDEVLDGMRTGFQVPDGYRLISKETRSRRLQLLLTPTLYGKVKQAADAHGMKVNDYIHRVLDLATGNEDR